MAIALTLPFFLPYLSVQRDAGFTRTLDDARMYSADVSAWFASAAWAHRWWLPWIQPFNEVLFPGLAAIGLGQEQSRGSIRIGFGRYTTVEQLEQAADLIDRAATQQE